MKPFFCYYGGKWRAAKHYPAPQYPLVIEPFAGAAGYSTHYAPESVLLLDADPTLARLWGWLATARPEDVLSLPDIAAGQDVRSLDVPRAAQDLIGFWLNKGAAQPMRTPSAWMRSGIRPNSYWGRAIRERIAAQLPLRNWQAVQADYRAAPDVEATWFIDPPYVGRAGGHYKHGSRDLDYAALGEWCRTRRGQVIVCEAAGADWLPFRELGVFKANPSKTGGKRTAEAVWP